MTPVTTGPLIFPAEVAQLREMAEDTTRTVARKIDDQRHVINTYEAAITELQARLRLATGIIWVLAGLNVALVIVCVWRIWQ